MPLAVSMATQIEDWLVAQIQAILVDGSPLFNAEDVKPWEGNLSPSASDFASDLMEGERDTVVRVMYLQDTIVPIDGNQVEVRSTYVIVVGQRNLRGKGGARRGGDTLGTNDIRDLLQQALHDKQPAVGANGKYSRVVTWAGSQIIAAERNAFVQQSNVIIAELPATN